MKVDELRSALHDHAEELSAGSPVERVASVRGRIARAKRRRSTTAGVAALAVLAAVGAGVVPRLVSDPPRPADGRTPARLAGHAVPTTQYATGFTYDYAQGVQSRPGAKRLVLRLPDSNLPRLVMWASSDDGDAPTVRLSDTLGADERSAPGGFDRYYYLDGGQDRIVLTQRDAGPRTRLALATYTRSKTPPPGVSNGTVTYRRDIVGKQLLGARIGRRGDSDVRLRFTVPQQRVWLSDVCYGSDASYEVSVAGQMMIAGRCADSPDLDPGTGGMSSDRPLGRPGQTVEARVRLVKSMKDSSPVTDPHVVLGIGAYVDRTPTVPVAGTRQPTRLERDGHLYRAIEWSSSDPGVGLNTMTTHGAAAPLLVTAVRHGLAGWSRVVLTRDGHWVADFVESPSGSEQRGEDLVIQPGQSPRVAVRATRGVTPRTEVGLVVYTQVH